MTRAQTDRLLFCGRALFLAIIIAAPVASLVARAECWSCLQ